MFDDFAVVDTTEVLYYYPLAGHWDNVELEFDSDPVPVSDFDHSLAD